MLKLLQAIFCVRVTQHGRVLPVFAHLLEILNVASLRNRGYQTWFDAHVFGRAVGRQILVGQLPCLEPNGGFSLLKNLIFLVVELKETDFALLVWAADDFGCVRADVLGPVLEEFVLVLPVLAGLNRVFFGDEL